MEALCLLAKRWKKPKCPLTGEYIHKTCYSPTMECYSPIERNEELSHALTGWTLLILCSMKEEGPKRLYIMTSFM